MRRFLIVSALLVGAMMGIATQAQVAPKGASIEGTWLLTALEMEGKRDTTNKNVNNVSLVFGADGKYAVKPKGYEFAGTYKGRDHQLAGFS